MDVGAEIKGQYRIVEHIGRGGMADVWSARDMRLNRLVAIKTIAHGLSSDVDPVKMFEREAQTIANLEHPHILPIYDFGESQGQLYIVMRFVTGGSLEDLLERGPLLPKDVLRIGEAIAKALDYAHSRQIIHLDLKPPNILLDSAQTPYLADFGLARVLDREGRAQNPGAGTLLYMAPEQLAADVLDHRADIFSFAVMLYHMLTGQLPFDATTSLALKQLQFQEEIPELDKISPSLPAGLTYVLRRGTAVNPDDRPQTVMALMEEFRDVLSDAMAAELGMDMGMTAAEGGMEDDYAGVIDMDASKLMTEGAPAMDDMALLEAVDLYSRARHAWAGGRGRFLLGVSHFMLMNGYYTDAKKHGLNIDTAGMQMLLRGALEYDQDIEYWWGKLDDDDRRWVCLHAIRSANAPTRIRALYRLETLPDADPPQIPKLVGQALQVEINQQAKLAALQVFGTRAKLVKPSHEYDIQTEYRGRMLTTMTRIGIQVRTPSAWREAVFSPEIDLLIAEIALDHGMPVVADFAARIVGRMRSLTAVRHIANEQRLGRPFALRALALVRDEAPSLPSVVSPQGRAYAWVANTWRRLTDHPLQLVWRYLLALIGGAIAMGEHVFITFRSEAIFSLQRWGNVIAMGLIFGVFLGFLTIIADEFSARLRGFWTWWMRLFLFGLLGFLLGTLTWGQFHSLYLQQQPEWGVLHVAGFGLALGFMATALFDLRGWQAFLLTAVATYVPINAAFASYFSYQFPLPLAAPIGLVTGIVIAFWARRRPGFPLRWDVTWDWRIEIPLSALVGLVWAFTTWRVFYLLFQQQFSPEAVPPEWDIVLLITFLSLAVGFIPTIFMSRRNWLAFAATALAAFGALYIALNGYFNDANNPILPNPLLAVLFYDDHPEQVLTVAIPFAIVIALGGYGRVLFSHVAEFIGKVSPGKERGAWMSGTLAYIMIASGIVGTLSLFTVTTSLLWGSIWVAWGLITFICALAAWRWKKWGARGLILCMIALVIGALAYDFSQVKSLLDKFILAAQDPNNFTPPPPTPTFLGVEGVFWAAWGIAIGICAWGALRRRLWAGIGLLAALLAWFLAIFFTSIPPSFFVLAVINLALVVYALSTVWSQMESGRVPLAPAQKPVVSPSPVRPLAPAETVPVYVPPPQKPVARAELATEFDANRVNYEDEEDHLETQLDMRENRGTQPSPHVDAKTELEPGSDDSEDT